MKKKLDFTKEALNQINKITHEGDKKYFRITVQGGGCSGFKYNFAFDKKTNVEDIIFNNTIIDKESLEVISGSVVDFKNISGWTHTPISLIFERSVCIVLSLVLSLI